MADQPSEIRNESLRLLQLLQNQLKKNDSRRNILKNIIQDVQTGTLPPPTDKEDWEAVCHAVGLSAEELRYRKILNHLPKEDKEYFNQVRRHHLKK
jgi:hypothetical protein